MRDRVLTKRLEICFVSMWRRNELISDFCWLGGKPTGHVLPYRDRLCLRWFSPSALSTKSTDPLDFFSFSFKFLFLHDWFSSKEEIFQDRCRYVSAAIEKNLEVISNSHLVRVRVRDSREKALIVPFSSDDAMNNWSSPVVWTFFIFSVQEKSSVRTNAFIDRLLHRWSIYLCTIDTIVVEEDLFSSFDVLSIKKDYILLLNKQRRKKDKYID